MLHNFYVFDGQPTPEEIVAAKGTAPYEAETYRDALGLYLDRHVERFRPAEGETRHASFLVIDADALNASRPGVAHAFDVVISPTTDPAE